MLILPDYIIDNIITEIKNCPPNLWKPVPPETDFEKTFQVLINNQQCSSYDNCRTIFPIQKNQLVAPNNPFFNSFEIIKNTKFFLQHTGIYGKVSIWKINPSGCVNYHTDIWKYHYQIKRWMINVNMDQNKCDIIVNDEKINVPIGGVYCLPHLIKHKINMTMEYPAYFLNFDTYLNTTTYEEYLALGGPKLQIFK